MAEAARQLGTEVQGRRSLPEMPFNSINEPGCWLSESGELWRIPQEAVQQGSSPVIRRESQRAERFIQLSRNPYEVSHLLRLLAAEVGVQPAF